MKEQLLNRISVDKNICHGKPHIRGTRITVQQVLVLLADGASPEEIISEDFPDLVLEDIRACCAFDNQDERAAFIEKLRSERRALVNSHQ
ncbi:DUF433 domain-containing protein [candidate division KSB1 bacterium]|nr:DUF433 domain-containing protein [candidate division KSB1 bacterium]